MEKKVGIVSCYFKHNYGSMLQAYATQQFLDDFGLENETINIEQNIDFSKGKKKYYISQIFNYKFIKSKLGMIKLKFDKKINKKLRNNISIRDKKYEEFKKKYKLTKPYLTYSELTEQSKKYSSVLVGSDQLWLPVNVVADYYTLNWVPENINKISYSTSFGVSNIPEKYKEKYHKFLTRINFLSVRESKGCELVKKLSGKEAKLVCDPTLLLTKEQWSKVQDKDRIIKDKYILCYFLGNNIAHRKFVERLKEKTGLKIVSLNHADEYVKYSDVFADETPYNIGPIEWINLIQYAEFVCTDSFHGTIFSLIYNKDFFTFKRYSNSSKMSTNSRIESLLDIVDLKNRLLNGNEKITDNILTKINYSVANEKITEFRQESKKFLMDALDISFKEQKENDKIKYIQIDDKTNCCGCTACKNVCPTNAIEMKEDSEGFLYPNIDKEKCINCGMCKKVCPILNVKKEEKKQKAYIFQYNNDTVRRESTSGGAFTAIAEYVLNKNGIVFGAMFDESFKVIHQSITNIKDLYKFRNSKYVQSDLRSCFIEAKNNLEEGRWVCFSGTTCQIEGLKKFLSKDYDKLLTVDVVCRAVPSPLVWKKYLEVQTRKYKNINKILFRDKIYGYKYSNLSIYSKKSNYHKGIETDPYLRAFFSNICDRPSCYNCKFKKIDRLSDITIWDCFEVEKYNKEFDDDKGTTRILVNSEKGEHIIEIISKKHKAQEISVEEATKGFLAMFQSVKENRKRKQFFDDMNSMEPDKVFNKYFSNNFKAKIERFSRITLIKLGIYKTIIRLGKRVRKRE